MKETPTVLKEEIIRITPENIDFLISNPEKCLVEIEADEEDAEIIYEDHRMTIVESGLFLGKGNSGYVSSSDKTDDVVCVKHIWEDNYPQIEVKGKRFDLLPPFFQALRKIQDHLEIVKAKHRAIESRSENTSFITPNSPTEEAGFQIIASYILNQLQEELSTKVPKIIDIHRVKIEEEGSVQGLPFMAEERVFLVSMEKINGKSLEDLILEYPENKEVIDRIDIEDFANRIVAAINLLHQNSIFHNDITLRNIMLDFDTMRPVIIDFGKTKKSSTFGFDADDEKEHLRVVINWLRKLKTGGEATREELISSIKKLDKYK